jgi:cytochrome P450
MNLDFITLQLCVQPDMQEALREEIGNLEDMDYHRLQNLPLLDSFIKETVRLHPLDTSTPPLHKTRYSSSSGLLLLVAVRRKALEDYTFTGGAPFCPSGSTVCVSSYDLVHNEKDYPEPNKFLPRRFIDVDSPVRGTKFTNVSEKFPVWGYGSLAW